MEYSFFCNQYGTLALTYDVRMRERAPMTQVPAKLASLTAPLQSRLSKLFTASAVLLSRARKQAVRLTHWIVCLACFAFAISFSAPQAMAWQSTEIRRLYVEPFTTKTGSETLRSDVTSELRKLNSISLVPSAAGADVILAGGGEIWVKGYRSLNPRSGRSPSNGTPVYAGYLSVELEDPKGETLWSYLVTPGSGTEDVSKDLSKRIAKLVAEALEQGLTSTPAVPLPQPTTVLKGAGATFPYPVYQKWFTNYRRLNPNLEIIYDPVGSKAGVSELLAGTIDFGASDSPEVTRELAVADESKYLFFPSVIGAVVPIVNLPGFPGDIAFTPEALAGIYLGKIKKWNDPILEKANRGLHLPDLDIVVVHRSDGSGTSFAWTDYLSKISPEWKAEVGLGLMPAWPTGRAATGNDGVAKLVKEIGGSIGYVEFIYALQNHLSYGAVRNRNGEFVAASLASMAVSATQSIEIGEDLKASLVNSRGSGAYPIASFTWFVVPAHIGDDAKRNAVTSFLRWMLGPGQTQAAALGYLSLPKDLVTRELAAIDRIH
jgi:phosphate transport system substrate-binding protein